MVKSSCIKTVLTVHTFPFLFENGVFFSSLAFRPHISIESGHRKRVLKTVENAVLLYSSGWVKTKFLWKRLHVRHAVGYQQMWMLQSKIVPNRFSFTIAFSCGRAKMIKKTQHVDDDFWKAEISVSFQANTDTLYWNNWAQNEKKKKKINRVIRS